MTVINTNTSALRAQNASRLADNNLNTAMTRLSSGKSINSASDNAAGLAISSSMTAQINGMNQAISNANDGVSLAQTADGALGEVTNMVQRINQLAVQSANGTYQNSDREDMNTEVNQLQQQITQVIKGTNFNGSTLFSTDTAGKKFQIQTGTTSAAATDRVTISISGLSTLKTIMSNATLKVATSTDALKALSTINKALTGINTTRAGLGA
ncbi:flagellin, partial [Zymomonas mobilis]